MSRETLHHLNTNTLIGNTDQRGTAWHYRAEHQGEETNHYPGPVPVADVQRRLFHWTADSCRIAVEVPTSDLNTMTHLDPENRPVRWQVVDDRQAIARSDRRDGKVLGIFGAGYVRHQYNDWLLNTVADLLDHDVAISSAGLLRGGAVAWVEVSVPDTITTPEGVAFRPNLLATTSFDGSIATTFKRTVTDTVCDNTRAIALAETGQQFKVKHSRRSMTHLSQARDALALIHTLGDQFAAEVAQLVATPVSGSDWDRLVEQVAPLADNTTGRPLTGRGASLAQTKREALHRLYWHDTRVAPWAGTAHGVLQAVNTYEHHLASVRGSRSDRNLLRTATGGWDSLDRTTWGTLEKILLDR